jgi:hypothetical protein
VQLRAGPAAATVGPVFPGSSEQRFAADDGSADSGVTAALSAFAAGAGSEHAALTALAGTRLLVPVVAALAPGGEQASEGEKASEMTMPALVGRDGRRAIPAFTSLDSLARWQPSARPIPVEAALVWRAAVEDSCAVVVDVAGPIPLAVEGARLAALASGAPAPLPHEDPDIQAAVTAMIAESAAAAGITSDHARFALHAGAADADLLIELTVPATLNRAAAEGHAAQVGSAVMDQLSARLRRGIAITLAAPSSPSSPDG